MVKLAPSVCFTRELKRKTSSRSCAAFPERCDNYYEIVQATQGYLMMSDSQRSGGTAKE